MLRKSRLVLFFTLLISPFALALEKVPFDPDHFATLQANNEVILVDVYADWCSTCARQQRIIQAFRDENPRKPFHVLEIDFDDDKQWVRHFRAPRQSTLLLYAGEQQFWFSVAETRPEIIHAELSKALDAVGENQ